MIHLSRVPLDKAHSACIVSDHRDDAFMAEDSPLFTLSSTG